MFPIFFCHPVHNFILTQMDLSLEASFMSMFYGLFHDSLKERK